MEGESPIKIILIVFGCASSFLLVLTLLCCIAQSRHGNHKSIPCCRNSKIHPPQGGPSLYPNQSEYYIDIDDSETESSDDEGLYGSEHSQFLWRKRRKNRLRHWPNYLLRSDPSEKSRFFPEIDMKKVRMKSTIGKGNYGEVLLAYYMSTPVAVKVILPEFRGKEKSIQRFRHEISLMASLHHPNVVSILGASTKGSNLCLVMEYCAHGSLHSFLRKDNAHGIPITLPLQYRLALDIARGMRYLHTRCFVIQRDLKARNILIDQSLNAKIADFGLSRVIGDELEAEQSKLTACGTPAWTAPEVIRMEHYTEKVDVYSFGIILWEIIAREEPYEDRKGMQIAYAVAKENLRPPVPPNCPERFAALMQSCWATKPEDRPSFDEIVEILSDMRKEILTSS